MWLFFVSGSGRISDPEPAALFGSEASREGGGGAGTV